MADCPRCPARLEEHQLDNFAFRLCRACRGILGRHADVIQVVESSWSAISEQVAEETPLHGAAETARERVFRCADCRQPMEKYGYMGMRAITIDRCDPCALLWLDADELQNMVLARARDQYRSQRALASERAGRLDLARGVVPSAAGAREVNWLFPARSDAVADGVAGNAPLIAVTLLRLLGTR